MISAAATASTTRSNAKTTTTTATTTQLQVGDFNPKVCGLNSKLARLFLQWSEEKRPKSEERFKKLDEVCVCVRACMSVRVGLCGCLCGSVRLAWHSMP